MIDAGMLKVPPRHNTMLPRSWRALLFLVLTLAAAEIGHDEALNCAEGSRCEGSADEMSLLQVRWSSAQNRSEDSLALAIIEEEDEESNEAIFNRRRGSGSSLEFFSRRRSPSASAMDLDESGWQRLAMRSADLEQKLNETNHKYEDLQKKYDELQKKYKAGCLNITVNVTANQNTRRHRGRHSRTHHNGTRQQLSSSPAVAQLTNATEPSAFDSLQAYPTTSSFQEQPYPGAAMSLEEQTATSDAAEMWAAESDAEEANQVALQALERQAERAVQLASFVDAKKREVEKAIKNMLQEAKVAADAIHVKNVSGVQHVKDAVEEAEHLILDTIEAVNAGSEGKASELADSISMNTQKAKQSLIAMVEEASRATEVTEDALAKTAAFENSLATLEAEKRRAKDIKAVAAQINMEHARSKRAEEEIQAMEEEESKEAGEMHEAAAVKAMMEAAAAAQEAKKKAKDAQQAKEAVDMLKAEAKAANSSMPRSSLDHTVQGEGEDFKPRQAESQRNLNVQELFHEAGTVVSGAVHSRQQQESEPTPAPPKMKAPPVDASDECVLKYGPQNAEYCAACKKTMPKHYMACMDCGETCYEKVCGEVSADADGWACYRKPGFMFCEMKCLAFGMVPEPARRTTSFISALRTQLGDKHADKLDLLEASEASAAAGSKQDESITKDSFDDQGSRDGRGGDAEQTSAEEKTFAALKKELEVELAAATRKGISSPEKAQREALAAQAFAELEKQFMTTLSTKKEREVDSILKMYHVEPKNTVESQL
eukprot:gnl/TRDRNA2_/TRDRNA2_187927_c0_seq1.p1 gnl/TRDRNA2_/TRDRNA2_187927_c0~~gnl/TRDRNA2_/TRDRNA2_187927_c0_seq1.p1  ORF type:complete len:772 (-),score=211.40 gnl/TRDRNA2_/TRDRNA2_187927_c0_seq1:129-2444(-)